MLRIGWMAVCLLGTACAGNVVDRSRAGDPSAGGSSGTGGAPGAGGTTAGAGGGAIFVVPPAAGGAPDFGCSSTQYVPDFADVPVLLLVDRSAGWGDPDASGLWPAVTNAISTLVEKPYAANVRVALGYFPGDPDDAGACNRGFTLAVPFQVAKDAAPAIRASLESTPSTGPRSLGSSLASAIEYARSGAAPESGSRLVVVTGGPTECGLTDLAPLTAAHPEVTSSVLGVGPGLSTLGEWKPAFGTAEFVETADEPHLVRALAEESGLASACTVLIPPVPDGHAFNPTLVNVQLTPVGGATEPLYYVDDETGCATPGAGWHYDSATAPTRVILCESACQRTPGAALQILLGCEHPGPMFR